MSYSLALDASLDPVPDLIGDSAMDISDIFNFDEFESGSGAESSPNTISPNHTPSPVAFAPSPLGNYGMGDFNYGLGEAKMPLGGPATMGDDIIVKDEPVDYYVDSFSLPTSSVASSSTTAVTTPPSPSFAGLPVEQQAALQQLLSNIMNYQQQYGAESEANVVQQSTAIAIDPSLVFASTPVVPAPPPTVSSLTPASLAAASTPLLPAAVSESHDELLVSIDQGESAPSGTSRSTRADSTFSVASGEVVDERIDKLTPLSSIFSAGRGKGGKKGGGMSSVVRLDEEDIDDEDSWRPSPEEYKKLSSKEKRQLRNKLSARAFRTRRKDYIGTLESHIKDRDTVIDAIRAELSTSRAENMDLRRELAALKSSTMSILHPESANKVGQSPAMLEALSRSPDLVAAMSKAPGSGPYINGSSSSPKRPTAAMPSVNTRKDIGTFDTRGFWGGNDNMFGGGPTICHTLLTPEIILPPRANINPLFNNLPVDEVRPPIQTLASAGNGRDITSSTFSEWSETTPFSLRSVDSYRMQIWSRLAREAAAEKANLSTELRPKFLVEPTGDEASTLSLASIATSHVATKLTSSFWSAFTGSAAKLDTDKLTAVVTGAAHLAVVPTLDDAEYSEKSPVAGKQPSVPSRANSPNADTLAHAMAGLKVTTGSSNAIELLRVRENPLGVMAGFFKHTAMPARA